MGAKVPTTYFSPYSSPIFFALGFDRFLKDWIGFLKETYQILNGALIGPCRTLTSSAASLGELILAKIVFSVKYQIILRIETGKMISVA